MEKMTDEQRKRTEDNIRLAYYMAHRWNHKLFAFSFDEIVSACMFGLCKASITYKEGKGRFSNYAYRVMHNEIMQLLRHYKNHLSKTKPMSEYTFYSKDENDKRHDNDVYLKSLISKELMEKTSRTDKYVFMEKELYNQIKEGFKESEVYLFEQSAEKKKSHTELAQETGVTQSCVSRKIKRIKKEMRKKYHKIMA